MGQSVSSADDALLAECVARLPAPILKIIARRYAEAYYPNFYWAQRASLVRVETEVFPYSNKTFIYIHPDYPDYLIYYRVYNFVKKYQYTAFVVKNHNMIKRIVIYIDAYTRYGSCVHCMNRDADMTSEQYLRMIKLTLTLIYKHALSDGFDMNGGFTLTFGLYFEYMRYKNIGELMKANAFPETLFKRAIPLFDEDNAAAAGDARI